MSCIEMPALLLSLSLCLGKPSSAFWYCWRGIWVRMLSLGVIRTGPFLCFSAEAFKHLVEPVCLSRASAESPCISPNFAFLLATVFKAATV